MLGLENLTEVTEVESNVYKCEAGDNVARFGYEGLLMGQAVYMGLASVPNGFLPHSLHASFLSSIDVARSYEWTVEQLSTGRTFCTKEIKALQNGKTKFSCCLSLTKKNSFKASMKEYEESIRMLEGKDTGDSASYDDSDEIVAAPLRITGTYPQTLKEQNLGSLMSISDVPLSISLKSQIDSFRNGRKVITKEGASCYVKLSSSAEIFKSQNETRSFVVLAIASTLSDLSNTLYCAEFDVNVRLIRCLNQSLYFHDSDIDSSEWLCMNHLLLSLANGRALVESQIFNNKRIHIASMVREFLALEVPASVRSANL